MIDRQAVCMYSQLIGGFCPSQRCSEHSPGSLCASWPVLPKPEPGSPSSVLPPLQTALAHGSFPFRGQSFPHAGSDKSRREIKALRLTPYAALLDRIASVYKVAAKKFNLSASEISCVDLFPLHSFSCLPKTDRLPKGRKQKGFCV